MPADRHVPHGDDSTVLDGDVADIPVRPCAINDSPTVEYQICLDRVGSTGNLCTHAGDDKESEQTVTSRNSDEEMLHGW
jgi:hypothetical protein